MLSFVQNWLGTGTNPIGIDFGTDQIRLAQVQRVGEDHHLLAAASCEVPDFAKVDFESRLDFFSQAMKELLTSGRFKGRRVVLSLPASLMQVRHFRFPKSGKAEFHQALQREAQTQLPFNPASAVLRHLTAGEVMHQGQVMQEVILIAAAREAINKYLAAAAKLKLNVVAMNVEPLAIVDCFTHVHRRRSDVGVTSCYVDLGSTGTRVTIARGSHVLAAQQIAIGGAEINDAVAEATSLSAADASMLRLKLAASDSREAFRDQRNVSPIEAGGDHDQARAVREAITASAKRIAEELLNCRRDHAARFPAHPIQRLIFVGGEARHRSLCKQIAREVRLPAQIGDPLVRMARLGEIPIESGIDRRLPQPAWAVAIGLSFGSPRAIDAAPPLNAVAQPAAVIDPEDEGVLLNAAERFTDAALVPAGADR